MKKIVLSIFAVSALLMTSCSDEKDPIKEVKAPSTYTFSRDAKSTVSYSGQQTRLDMHTQLKSALGAASTAKVDETVLNKMFNHKEGTADFTDGLVFLGTELNASKKNISGATASSKKTTAADEIYTKQVTGYLNSIFIEAAKNSGTEVLASKGTAGIMNRKADGSKKILVDANGFEYVQEFSKSLMGAMELDQIVNKYLSSDKLNVENDKNKEGKNHTEMEHHWDEAFGYSALSNNALAITDKAALKAGDYAANYRFWGGYIYSADASEAGKGVKDRLMNAFLKGRQAIVDKNYPARDEQATIIKKELSLVCAIRAAHYLDAGVANVNSTDDPQAQAGAFHELSEGLGFVYSLQFTNNGSDKPYFSKTEVAEMVTKLKANGGLYQDNIGAVLKELSEKVAKRFSFTIAEVK
ncbi:DUF4856 domain-containing protein [Tenacibaculum finnmarkense]|uniref:DUF4856 domain-containing protein n=1 Tax=Tenacibaculum finnmarkense TaxID=2781243 RepID=UPI001E60C0B3|nr:DUF4856 domain-containing protein [Tenacibaculum finnmarkense]MCD8447091.1 DUF4856 domain-containing protein [Tenacibaculum finnmarkense genomovar finnmarkense]MCG8207845.1 DUF4856 domain-containing protein [Tenacibaculum finnmarkense genomovar finnmarkense]MCG8723867.1 DUF4856 domain-containing protein [Tenacibaculum finnmarkense]MCG8742198.1 DUF4856 domain-containing protein [Tenacibaculum finnmarkense]MCG8765537.1 DUF4856 domain-containing protein [Tenacibaculum finnmarkense]